MKFIELTNNKRRILVNTAHIMLIEPFIMNGEETTMITLAHPLRSTGERKISVRETYDEVLNMELD